MKKRIIALAAVCAIFAAAGCNNGGNNATTTTAAELTTTTTTEATTTAAPETTEAATEAATEETTTEAAPADDTNGVMSHDDYIAAELDSQITVETYVQGKQGWWTNSETGVSQASFYAQNNPEGGYFLYNMPCSEEDYNKIVPGTKLRVSGYKSEWQGEVELIDTTFEIIDGDTFIAEAEDVTALLGTDDLIKHQNEFVSFKGMTVEEITFKDEANSIDEKGSFFYKWNNSGTEGDDLYFNVSKDGQTYTFTVESYLCGPDTQVYNDVKALNVGDTIDLEGFLYWYDGANPHITSITKA